MLRRTVQIGVTACIVALMVGGLSTAQQSAPGGGPESGPGGMFDPARMRQMMTAMMKERLGVKDDAEWQVIEPRLQKVMERNQQVQMSRMQGMFGMFAMFAGGRGAPGGSDRGPTPPMPGFGPSGGPTPPMPGFGQDGEATPVGKAMARLRTTLANQSASPDDIRKSLTALREVNLKMQQDRAVAQAELKKILTLRQEAVLVEMGQLD